MSTMLVLAVLFPAIGALLLALNPRMPDRRAAIIGVGSVGLSALATLWVVIAFLSGSREPTTIHLWDWVVAGDFNTEFSFYLDGLSITMISVVTGVGFLIHLFASWYMTEELEGGHGYPRFFAYMNLFILSMLLLVLANNLFLIYMGWELVGMCSYMLIGYHYKSYYNAWCGYKSFITTRVGDVFFAIGLFILFNTFGTLDVDQILTMAPEVWAKGDLMANLAALMLLGGAVGKSAQLPLQVWLPDAMAGPTPVSALIHAATMVTAGVYLIARTHGVFEMAPAVLLLVGIVGLLTLLLAGFAALVQTDIKRVLAYSTMSQIGYMFLALGVQAWDAAIFHLVTHAFFKALLFLTSGSIIIACHHEQNMFKMGGLRKSLQLPYYAYLIGSASLASLPFLTAGFFSKDEILQLAFLHGYSILWMAASAGAFLTALYTFRMVFVTFHGEQKIKPKIPHGIAHGLPLVVLAVLSTFVGAWFVPPLGEALPVVATEHSGAIIAVLIVIASIIAIAGIALAAGLYLGRRTTVNYIANSPTGSVLRRYWFAAWGFDWLYNRLFIQPWNALATLHRSDWIDGLVFTSARATEYLNGRLVVTQNGSLRWYALGLFSGGTVFLLLLLVLG